MLLGCLIGDIECQVTSFSRALSPPYGWLMNQGHLETCASDQWRETLRETIIPFVLAGARLGDDVLEVGPGPGLTTELLRLDVGHLTAVELDADLAADLVTRLAGTNVEVINGDATELPFDDQQFTAVVSCNMLHHIPTVDLQNRMFAEGARVLRAGGLFVATDCVASDELAAFHHEDTYNPIDPATLHRRLTAAGFTTIDIRTYDGGWAVHAHLPVG